MIPEIIAESVFRTAEMMNQPFYRLWFEFWLAVFSVGIGYQLRKQYEVNHE